MASTPYTYYPAMDLVAQAQVDLNSEPIKCMLLNSLYTLSQEHSLLSQVSTYEITGTNYVAGGVTLANQVYNRTNGVLKVTADNPAWLNATITCRWAVFYFPNLSGSPLLSGILLDNTPADIVIVNAKFELDLHESIVFQMTG